MGAVEVLHLGAGESTARRARARGGIEADQRGAKRRERLVKADDPPLHTTVRPSVLYVELVRGYEACAAYGAIALDRSPSSRLWAVPRRDVPLLERHAVAEGMVGLPGVINLVDSLRVEGIGPCRSQSYK